MRKLFQLILISLLSFGTHAQQISLIQDFGTNGLKLDDTAVFNGNLYFSTQEEAGFASTLYSVDSNNNITPLFTSTSSIFNLVQLGNHVYFTATGTSGWAFYRIDSSGTVSLVSETNAPFLDAIVFNNEIYFSGVNGGADLYAYNETTNSFRLVDANFDYGMGVSGLIVHNGELYFRGTIEGSTSNRALFKTNGSTISQVVAFDSRIYQDISNPYTFVSFGNELYFSAPVDASLNYQLFKVNTNSNQLALASTYYVVNNHIPFVFNNELYFTGRPSINSNSVYVLLKQNELGVITSIPLGTENGQIEVGSASFGSISEASDFYIVAFSSSVGFELFKINSDTLELFVDYVPGNTWGVSPNYSRLLSFNNKLYVGGGNLQSSGLSTQLLELPEAACINTININDNNFEAYLENVLNVGDGIVGNGLVCKEQIELITALDISNQGITDLTGLEAFSNLEILDVSNNNLNALELQNSSLVEIYANDCNLAGKPIRFQNAPPNGAFLTNVTTVELQNNGIGSAGSTISFGGIPNLTYLDISDNNFGTIQLNESTSIETLLANNCPNLTNLANLDALTNLQSLNVSYANLSTLNVSQNSQLFILDVRGNSMTTLDLSNNSVIGSVYASDNDLTTLSLPTTTALSELYLENNALTILDVSTADENLSDLDATGNPALGCIQVTNAANAETQGGWQKDTATNYSTNCSLVEKIVEVSVISGQAQDATGNYIITGANEPIQIGFDLKDENGNELDSSVLPNYSVNITTAESTTQNPARGGNVTVPGVDFELLTNESVQINTLNNSSDGNRTIAMQGDQLFEADEFFFIEVRTNDSNITLKNALNGLVQIPVKIVDNEVTNINLELVSNGAEPNQNARLRITSSLQNDTGAPLPFNISLAGGTAIIGEDYQALSNQPVIANGETSVEFDVIILNNDMEAETEEEFFVNLNYGGELSSSRVNIQVGAAGIEVPIVDDGNVDNTSFEVTATIEGAGLSPNYEIIEGTPFTLNFESDATATIDTQYTPNIEFTSNNNNSPTEDFTYNGNATLPTVPFTVTSANPDGGITILPIDDVEVEGDETYTITISSPDPSLFTIEGPTSFTVTVRDNIGTPSSINVTLNNVQIENGSFFIEEAENFFQIQIDVPNAPDGLEFSSTIDFRQSLFIEQDLSFYETDFTVTTSSNNIDYQNLISISLDDSVSELDDKIVLVLSKPDYENFVWANANANGEAIFEIAVLDNLEFSTTPVDVVFNSTNLTLLPPDIGFPPYIDNFSFPENSTENITISFTTENLSNNPISEYELRIQTSNSSAEEGADFVGINEIRTFSANENDEHVIEIEILDDQFLEVDDSGKSETFDLTISSVTPGVRIKSINGVLLEEDVDYSLNIEIIDDDNISEPFEVDVQLNGNFSNENGNLSIVEGENFEITFDADSSAAENYIYTVQYDTEGSTAFDETNYTLPNTPLDIRVQNTAFESGNPIDAQINFEVLNDLEEEAEELLVINFRPDTENIYTWKGADENGVLTFTINVLENTETNNKIIAKFSSTGGIEGGTDIYTIVLTDQQGNPFINDTGGNIEFQLNFTDERDTDLPLEIAQEDDGVPADESSYIAENGDSLDNAKIVIEPNQSTGTFVVNYPPDDDTDREFYTVEIEPLENQEVFDLQPSKIQSIILDEQGVYYAAIFPKPNGDLKLLPNVGEFNQSCCAGFSVEENSIIEFYVDVEKGVPATENANNPSFEIGFTFGGDAEISTSTERKDFSKRDDNDALEIIVNPSEPLFDNRLLLDIWDDGIPNERVKLDDDGNPETTSIGEKLLVSFSSQSDNLILKGPIFGNVYTFESLGALPTTSFDIRIIDVLSVASFEAVEGKSIALEEGETTAEFEIVLSEENVSGNDIIINYEILQNQNNSANPLDDFLVLDADLNLNTFRGQAVVLPGENKAKILIKAEDDARFEVDEFVTIRLLPGNGYSIGEGFTSQITIISEDEAEYTATIIEGADNESSESQIDDFAELVIELNGPPLNNNVEVIFKISDLTNQSVVVEGEDYLIYQKDKLTVISPDNRKVVFEANGGTRKSIFVRAILDDLEENNESLFLELDDGDNYRDVSTTEAEVILISATTNLNTFVPSSISVITKKPRCPGEDQKGSVEITNGSGFAFNVVVKGLDNNEEDSFELGKNSETSNNQKQTKELSVGRYEVALSFDTEKNASIPEDAIAPLFIVEIEELQALTVQDQGVNLNSKTGEFLVSGSTSYTVKANEDIYKFSFEDAKNNIINIPLKDGINDIEFLGEAICQGIVKKEILLNNIFIYPNPSESIVSIFSEAFNKSYNLYLFDIQGKLVYEINSSEATNRIDMDVSNLQKGMYLGKIMTEYNNVIEFKLLKK